MYPSPPACTVQIARLADHLCGRHRPGHFEGVATVVLKLLQIVRPARAYFGEKDAQQTAIVRRVVRDFNVPADIVEVPIVREPDGLAISSRNVHLGAAERRVAVSLYRALREAQRQVASGSTDAGAACRPPPGCGSSISRSSVPKTCSRSRPSAVRCGWPAPCGSAARG